MCLKQIGKELVAKKHITCYKVMHQTKTGGFTSMIYNCSWKLKEVKSAKLDVSFCGVHAGLHSFSSKKSAKVAHKYSFGSSRVIVKCVIPKGSIYYKGKQDAYNGYASNKLKIIKILK